MIKVYPIEIGITGSVDYLITNTFCIEGEIVEFSSEYLNGYARIIRSLSQDCCGCKEHNKYKYQIAYIKDNLSLIEHIAKEKGLV